MDVCGSTVERVFRGEPSGSLSLREREPEAPAETQFHGLRVPRSATSDSSLKPPPPYQIPVT